MLYSMSLSFKKIRDGLYAYYPISPFLSKAYFVSKKDKEKLEDLFAKKIVFVTAFVPLLSIVSALFSLKGFYVGVLTLLIMLVNFAWQKKVILKSYDLQDFPRLTIVNYSRDFSNSLSWKEIRGGSIGSSLFLIFAWFIVHGYPEIKSIPLTSVIVSCGCALVGALGLSLFSVMGLIKYRNYRIVKNG